MPEAQLQAAPPGGLRQPWPLAILEQGLGGLDFEYDMPAVVVVSGVFAPVHRGHLETLRLARVRLERAGYTVVAGFLSPCSDADVGARKADEDVADETMLCAEARFRLCELAAAEVVFTSAASWEIGRTGASTARWPEVAEALQSAISEKCGSLIPAGAAVSVFMACDGETVRLGDGLLAGKHQGLICVPRDGFDEIAERADDMVFVADEPLDKRVGDLTSAMLRRAIRNREAGYVRSNAPKAIANILLGIEPLKDMPEGALDILLKPAPEGPWPMRKAARWIDEAQGHDKPLALLVSTGVFGPIHRGHVAMMHLAKERLERAGYAPIGGWFSLASDVEARQEASRTDPPPLSARFRLWAAELAVEGDNFVAVRTSQVGEDGVPRRVEVMEDLVEAACGHYFSTLEQRPVRVFFVGGSDAVGTSNDQKNITCQMGYGVVVVPRDREDLLLEKPTAMTFAAEAHDEEAVTNMSGTDVRDAIRRGDLPAAEQALPAASARFLIRPTEEELRTFKADFDLLRHGAPPAPPDAGGGASSSGPPCLAQGVAGASVPAPSGGSGAAQGGVKGAFRKWAGDTGSLGADKLGKLLQLIDPTWSPQELSALFAGAKRAEGGAILLDDFVDWVSAVAAEGRGAAAAAGPAA